MYTMVQMHKWKMQYYWQLACVRTKKLSKKNTFSIYILMCTTSLSLQSPSN